MRTGTYLLNPLPFDTQDLNASNPSSLSFNIILTIRPQASLKHANNAPYTPVKSFNLPLIISSVKSILKIEKK